MTDICRYSFDPSEADDTSVEEPWSCPHETYVDTDYCVFHLPPETRDKLGLTDVDLRERLLQKVNQGSPEESAFVGAEFGALELDQQHLADGAAVDLRHTVVDGKLDLSGVEAEADLLFDDAELQAVDAPDASLQGASFRRAEFTASANFDGVEIETAVFSRANFDIDAVFSGATFVERADFSRCGFSGVKTSFDEASFEAGVDFTRARFGELRFTGAEVAGEAVFERATFKDDVNFEHTEFEAAEFSHAEFDGNSSFRGARFLGPASFEDATFRGWATFREVEFGSDAVFDSAWFKKDVNFVGESEDNSAVSLVGARINGGTIETNSFRPVFYDLARARVGPVKVTPGEDENPFKYVSFRQTKFNGFDFERHEELLDDIDWEFHDTLVHGDEVSDEVLEDTYKLAARDAKANDHGRSAKKLESKRAKYERRKLKSEGSSGQYVVSLVKSHLLKILLVLLVLGGGGAAAYLFLL